MTRGATGSTLARRAAALRDAFDSLSSRRLVLFGGKGGVGKTTLAALAGIQHSAVRRVVLFTTDPASSLPDIFGDAAALPAGLTLESLDANALYARFLEKNLASFLELGDRGTYLDRDELQRFFELALPGVDELMAWTRIGELVEENADALVVVDTAPTGHTLRMLGSSNHFAQLAQALDALQAKHRAIVRQLTRRSSRDAIDAFIEDFDADARCTRSILEQGAFIPVTLSESLVVEQTMRLVDEVRADGLDVPFAILNRAAPQCDCDRCREQAKRDEAAHDSIAGLVEAERACTPLDSVGRLRAYLAGTGAPPPDPKAAASRRTPKRRQAAALHRPRAAWLRWDSAARLVFFAGKGGVGKTTSATALALQLARHSPDEQFVLLSVDPAHSVRDVFAREAPPPNLTVETIDTRARWRELRERLGGEIERAVDAMTPSGLTVAYDGEAIRQLIDFAPPGADELFAISRLSDLLADGGVERVVVDTAPTGHFLRLLELPQSAGEWVREFMRILLRYRELVPAGSLGEELIRASRSLTAIDEALHSERAAVIVVTRAEALVVAETKRLIAELSKRGIATAGVIANYVAPLSDCRCDRSMRACEEAALRELGRDDLLVVERRDPPPAALDDIATLFDLH